MLTRSTPPQSGHKQCQLQTGRVYRNGPYLRLTPHILFVMGSLTATCMQEMPRTKFSLAFSLTLRFEGNANSSPPTSTSKTPYLLLPTVTFFPIFQVPISTSLASIQRPGVRHVGETHPSAWLQVPVQLLPVASVEHSGKGVPGRRTRLELAGSLSIKQPEQHQSCCPWGWFQLDSDPYSPMHIYSAPIEHHLYINILRIKKY